MINQLIAEQFDEIADMLEILGESVFRIRAYRRASDVVESFPQDLAELHSKDDKAIENIPGIGKDLHSKIVEIIETGKCKMHENLVRKLSPGVLDILRVRSIGPKKAKLFMEKLGINDLKKLRSAAESGALATLPGMGEKSQDAILKALDQSTFLQTRIPLYQALPEAEQYVEYMKKCKAVERVEYAGSLRRRQETIGDIDILATGSDSEMMSKHFLAYPHVKQVLAAGDTKSSVVLKDNIQVDLRVVKNESFGAAFYYFTGSKYHNIQFRTLAQKRGLKNNEYGVFKREKMIAGATEEEIFNSLGMEYIPPEIREDQGEIEAARNGKLPKLIEENDIKGDLHTHSKWSDGAFTIYEMAFEAARLGREYIAVSDHMRDPKEIKKQWKEIEKIQKQLNEEGIKIKILKGAEIDILKTGELNLPDEIIEKLDVPVISIHTSFNLSKKEQTDRILRAFAHPNVKIFGHPFCRMLGKRDNIEMDFEKILRAAKEKRIALEINSQPQRMDLNGTHAKMCKDFSVKVVINTDSHTTEQLSNMKFGLFMARRGWIEKGDTLNCLSYSKLMEYL
ncbi:DNA polymerase/3'-5' exonuclease PolX [Patescibacteria group bacterium]|nr:DNA polymerase/3'-5' exonuclease PolX [Patescibacteria group bacterium]